MCIFGPLDQCDQMARLIFQYLAIYNIENLPNSSVTRFGKISPLRQNFKQLWQILKGALSIWQNFEHTLATF